MSDVDRKIMAVSYTALMKTLRSYADVFRDKEQLQLIRDAADAIFFEPTSERTSIVTGQAFSMLKNLGMKNRDATQELGQVITDLQRLVSHCGARMPAGRPSDYYTGRERLTGFDLLRHNGEHII